MKQTIRLCLALCLLACLALIRPAAQASGDRVTALAGRDGFEDTGVEDICAAGNSIWMQDSQGVHVYSTETGETAHYPWNAAYRAAREGLLEDGDRVYFSVRQWFSWNGEVYALAGATRSGEGVYQLEDYSLCNVVIENGEAGVQKLRSIDWRTLEEDDSVQLDYYCVVDDVLCALRYTVTGDGALALIPLDGSATSMPNVPLGWISGVCPYKGGLLAVSYDSDAQETVFLKVDVKSGAAEEIGRLAGKKMVYCPAQSLDGDRILAVQDGQVILLDPISGEVEKLAATPVAVNQAQGCLTESGVYAAGNFEGVALIDTQQRTAVETELVISDRTGSEIADQAILTFSETHPEVSVIKRSASGEVLEELLTRSGDADIYILTTGYWDAVTLAAVQSRQWGAPMKSEAIEAFVAGLYPALAEACTGDEGVFLLPLSADVDGLGVGVGALKALGLSIEDVPTNWPDFLDFLNALAAEECTVPLGGWYSAADAYADLAERILATYSLEVSCGASEGYDTPELRAAFEALDRLDCARLVEISANSDAEVNPLISMAGCAVDGCTFQDDYDEYHLLLSISADRPARVAVISQVAMINPASTHVEAATAFLEECLSHLEEAALATLSPNQGEASRSSRFEAAKAEQAQKVESLKQQLAGAEEANRQTLEEDLQRAEVWLNEMENYYWTIAPQSLEWYRAHDDDVRFNLNTSLDLTTVYSQAMKAIETGEGSQALLAELQRQAEMRRLEE